MKIFLSILLVLILIFSEDGSVNARPQFGPFGGGGGNGNGGGGPLDIITGILGILTGGGGRGNGNGGGFDPFSILGRLLGGG